MADEMFTTLLAEATTDVGEDGMRPDEAVNAALDRHPELPEQAQRRLWQMLIAEMTSKP